MRDAAAAIEAALKELVEARDALPDEFAAEIDRVIGQTRILLESLATTEPDLGSQEDVAEPQADGA